jgi:DNA replication protein DnaC
MATALGRMAWQRNDPEDLLDQARKIAVAMKPKTGYRTDFAGKTDDGLSQALKEACLMLARMRRGLPAHWLTLSGTNGTGKTMLAQWLASQMEVRMPERLIPRKWTGNEIKATYLGGGWGLPADLGREEWLLVDELGAEREQPSFREAMIDMLNRRMGRWTIITSNLSERELEQAFSSRLTSRMIRDGNVHVRIESPDYFTRI